MSWMKFFRALFHPEGDSPDIYDRFHEMLEIARKMFDLVSAPLFDESAPAPERSAVKALDAELNRLEQVIRQRLLTAVAVHAEQDTALRLLMLGLVRDAERCGDFAKHLHDVFAHSGGALPPCTHTDTLRDQRAFIQSIFANVWQVYEAGDHERARAILREAKAFSKRDNEIVHALLAGEEAPKPVALAMAARFFKRIQGHLAHVLQSVVTPDEASALVPDEDV